jgi:hypothetical protein
MGLVRGRWAEVFPQGDLHTRPSGLAQQAIGGEEFRGAEGVVLATPEAVQVVPHRVDGQVFADPAALVQIELLAQVAGRGEGDAGFASRECSAANRLPMTV